MKLPKSLFAIAAALTTVTAAPAQDQTNSNDPELNFEFAWQTIDRTYAGFDSRQIDWQAIYEIYRPQITPETTDEQLFDTLITMIGHTNDSHVCINNGSQRICGSFIEELTMDDFSRDLVKTKYLNEKSMSALDGKFTYSWLTPKIAYLHIHDFKLGMAQATAAIDTVIAEFTDADALVIDIRANTGGNGFVTNAVANRFADRKRHYMTTRTRYGTAHDDFAPPVYRYLEPEGPAQFTKPTIVLAHRFSESAADMFDLALRTLPHVTVIGEITGGALGTSYDEPMPNGWVMTISFMTDRDNQGTCWDGIGIPPDLRIINTKANIQAGIDKPLEFAIKLLKSDNLIPQPDPASLKILKTSMVLDYVNSIDTVGFEAAFQTLTDRFAAQDEAYYFAIDEVFRSAGVLMNSGKINELKAMVEFASEKYPQVAGLYGMRATANLALEDLDAVRKALDQVATVEAMYSWEKPMIERAQRILDSEN